MPHALGTKLTKGMILMQIAIICTILHWISNTVLVRMIVPSGGES
jgi:hypothetical protein